MIKKLRKRYPKFVYERFNYKLVDSGLYITFDYTINPGITFRPEIRILGVDGKLLKKRDKNIIGNLVFNLGMIELISYWKSTCSPEIIVKAGFLSGEQIKWWKLLIERGMSQFYYENKIDFKDSNFVQIKALSVRRFGKATEDVKKQHNILIPIGGGKDSAVTVEILKNISGNNGAFVLNPRKAALDIYEKSGLKNLVVAERVIDKRLLELNSRDYLNGHTPFSAYLAFLSTLCAYLFDYSDIAFSNELSSNEGNVEYLGIEINHQYSKTIEFENNYRRYLGEYMLDVNYFSFLRPLYELQIAKIFSKMEGYFTRFSSCNIKEKDLAWCRKCSKCLSTYILLYPFLSSKDVKKIFGSDLFQDASLLPLLQELVDENKVKPFECVGTRNEIKLGLYLSVKKFLNGSNLPTLLAYFRNNFVKENRSLQELEMSILENWDGNNNLEKKYISALQKYLDGKY